MKKTEKFLIVALLASGLSIFCLEGAQAASPISISAHALSAEEEPADEDDVEDVDSGEVDQDPGPMDDDEDITDEE